jgi:GNAT superfamily N-acetyltransferase
LNHELTGVSLTLARAFVADPVFGFCFPDAGRLSRALPAFFDLVVQTLAPYDEIYTVGDSVGSAVWVPPDRPMIPEDAEESFNARLAEIAGADLDRMVAMISLLGEHHPQETCAYLWFVGVDPAVQGCGHGSALMAPVLQRCDTQRTPAYLEATTTRNRDLYGRHGFQVVTELAVPDGPPMWPMWRDPVAA